MSEIRVPEGMFEAARRDAEAGTAAEYMQVKVILEAALRWLDGELKQMRCDENFSGHWQAGYEQAIQAVRRRMFSPEPPEDEDAQIRDLFMPMNLMPRRDLGTPGTVEIDNRIREAFRRGRATK